jgi:L,D-transpeptidase YcbB
MRGTRRHFLSQTLIAGMALLAFSSCNAADEGLAARNLNDLDTALASAPDQGFRDMSDWRAALIADSQGDMSRVIENTATAYARMLVFGQTRPTHADKSWFHQDLDADPQPKVIAALRAGTLQELFATLEPANTDYAALKLELARLRQAPDNSEAQNAIIALRATLERWRWMPRTLPATRLWVDLPFYQLRYFREDDVTAAHDVIIGQVVHQTPQFSVNATGVIFNPWWDPPARLVREKVVPLARAGRATGLGYKLYHAGKPVSFGSIRWKGRTTLPAGYVVRQSPGRQNALGQVKLHMHNGHDVYLHDTPNKELFTKDMRALSNGCVRVSGALDLAFALLTAEKTWTAAQQQKTLETNRETEVDFITPLPVYLVYMTATATTGAVTYAPDVYGKDAELVAALDNPARDTPRIDMQPALAEATASMLPPRHQCHV